MNVHSCSRMFKRDLGNERNRNAMFYVHVSEYPLSDRDVLSHITETLCLELNFMLFDKRVVLVEYSADLAVAILCGDSCLSQRDQRFIPQTFKLCEGRRIMIILVRHT